MIRDMVGTRIHPELNGYLDAARMLEAATYGRAQAGVAQGSRAGWWSVTAPDGVSCSINPSTHTVTEHDDGTISIRPSIDMTRIKKGGWHGWLIRGVFRSCQ